MNTRYAKSIITRTKRLSEAFLSENGRNPTVAELGELYSQEMRKIASKSSRNQAGTGGFAKLSKEDPEKFKQQSSQGGKRSKRGKDKN